MGAPVRRSHAGRLALVAVSAVVGLGLVALVIVLGPAEVAARLTEPGVLTTILVVNLVAAMYRLLPTLHAWRVSGGRNVAIGFLIALVVLGPHAAAGYVGYETRQALDTIFAAPTAATTTTTTTVPATTPTVSPSTTDANDDPGPTTTTLAPTTTTTVAPEESRLTVLLLGGDAGPGRSGLRTDSVIVASVDQTTGDAALFSLPRNWGGLELADGSVIPERILNEVYEWGRRQPDRFPGVDPGAVALVEVAEVLTGLDIDYFALVDLTGFAALIDALGGVTIDVPRSVYGPSYDPATGSYTMIDIPSGEQDLTGAEALAYVRERYQSSDYDRMRRQRCVLASLAADADVVTLLRGIRGILDAMERHVTTDIPREEVPVLIRTASRVDDIRVVGFDNRWRRGWDAEGFAVPDAELVRETVRETLENPEAAEETFGIRDAEAACG